MTIVQGLVKLNKTLGDTDNFTFTSDEKTRALEEAWDDPYNTKQVWDESTTYDQSTYQYTVPSGITIVKGLYYKSDSTEYPDPVPSEAYDVTNGNIYITPEYRYYFNQGSTIVVKGLYRVTSSDEPATDREEYLLKLAHYNVLSYLAAQKANKFLKNDTSMAEILTLRDSLSRDIREMRKRFNAGVERV